MSAKRIKKKRRKAAYSCALCGKPLPEKSDQRIIGKTGQGVCVNCLQVSRNVAACMHEESKCVNSAQLGVITPGEMIERLDKLIIGQSAAKQAVAMALWKQQLRAHGVEMPNAGLMLHGPTGCGKTALVREAAKIAGLPFLSFDATTLSETGYRGRDAADMIRDLVSECGPERAQHGIIFLDEIDKLAAVKGNEYRAVYSRGTQHSLLKIVEGTTISVDDNLVNTGGILFLFGGAFTGLPTEAEVIQKPIGFNTHPKELPVKRELEIEDFIDYGMEAELMGRIGRCVALEKLSEEHMKRILFDSELSVLRKYQKFFVKNNLSLEMSEDEATELVRKAVERGTGARGLNALVEEWVEPKLLALAERRKE